MIGGSSAEKPTRIAKFAAQAKANKNQTTT